MLDSLTRMANFTLQDACGSVACVMVFAACLGTPGYVVAYALDLFGFRRMGRCHQAAWAIALSFAVSPILCYLVGRVAGLNAVCGVLLATVPAALGMAWSSCGSGGSWKAGSREAERRAVWWVAAIAAAWTAFALLMLLDVQVGHKLYFSIVTFDQGYRVAFTDSVLRTGVPPANPLYFPGRLEPMRYYYFWYVLCGAVARIAHASARQAFLASSVWTGFGLAAMVGLCVRHFFGVTAQVRRQTAIFVALLAVTGLDLLPTLGMLAGGSVMKADMEWWAIDQIASWQDSVLWVPHHVASLLACLTAFVLFWKTREERRWSVRISAAVLAGAGAASAFGLSVYVAAGFGFLMAAWSVRALSKRNAGVLGNGVLAALGCGVLLAPFFGELLRSVPGAAGAGQGSGLHVLAFGVRSILDPAPLEASPMFAGLRATHPLLLESVVRLALLGPGLVIELGVYGVVFLLLARRKAVEDEAAEARGLSLFLAGWGLVLVSFVRSAVISSNDFGFRAALLPQFFLLLLTGDVLASWWCAGRTPVIEAVPKRKRMIYALLVLGGLATLYQGAVLRLYIPMHEGQAANGFGRLAEEAFAMRTAFAELDRRSPRNAVLEFDPTDVETGADGKPVLRNPLYARSLILYAGRQLLSAEPGCGAAFGGDARPCEAITEATKQLYATPVPDAAWAQGYCRRFGVEYLAVGERDDAWREGGGWIAGLPAVATEPGFRILRCATVSASQE